MGGLMSLVNKSSRHKNHKSYFVPGLSRGLQVLEILAEWGTPMTVSEIAHELGVSRSSAFRTIYTLTHMQFISSTDEGRVYQLGARILNLGFSFLASQDLVQKARPELTKLRDDIGISSHLAILEQRDVLFLECVQSTTGYLSNVNVGHRIPAHASPLGWLLMSDLSARELAECYKGVKFEKLTDQTPKTFAGLTRAVARARTEGIVVSDGIAEAGGRSVSAPVFDRDGQVTAAIDISGPASACEMEQLATTVASRVEKAAVSISQNLGYQPKAGHNWLDAVGRKIRR